MEGPSKVDIQTEDLEDGTCKVSYFPTVPGVYIVSTKFADEHVPGARGPLRPLCPLLEFSVGAVPRAPGCSWSPLGSCREPVHREDQWGGESEGEHHPHQPSPIRGHCREHLRPEPENPR